MHLLRTVVVSILLILKLSMPSLADSETDCSGAIADHVYDLQERVSCLEGSLDQLLQQQQSPSRYKRDCTEVTGGDGVYEIQPEGATQPFNVTCRFDDNGSWIVLQRRVDDSISFYRSWVEYKKGFGTQGFHTNLWLGLDYMHQITTQRQYMLRVELVDFDDVDRYAEYSMFWIGDEDSGYQLNINGYSGNLPDKFTASHVLNGMKFSTADRDNDLYGANCAMIYPSGWWHRGCYHVNLNGEYREPPNHLTSTGIQWYQARGAWYSMKESYMLIKPAFDD